MQSSQDEQYPWVDDNDKDAPSYHVEIEWTNLSTNDVGASLLWQAGYRGGISAGKEAAQQEGFDMGFADTGTPRGRELGVLRGLAAAHLHLSPRPAAELGQTQVQAHVREIVEACSCVPSGSCPTQRGGYSAPRG